MTFLHFLAFIGTLTGVSVLMVLVTFKILTGNWRGRVK